MYLLTSDRKSILDTEFVKRFSVVEHPDTTLVIASYGPDFAVTVGKYKDSPEAAKALFALLSALTGDEPCFEMPDSALFHQERKKRDARVKRKGGS